MTIREMLFEGNRNHAANGDGAKRKRLAKEGQSPYAIVICCSDSRVIPEQIFSADMGDLFVIRVAGNVLDRHPLGSIEYAAEHLGCRYILMLGHTGCGAIAAAVSGHAEGFVSAVTDEIRKAIGMELDPDTACRQNVRYGTDRIRAAFQEKPWFSETEVAGAVYDIGSGTVEWL